MLTINQQMQHTATKSLALNTDSSYSQQSERKTSIKGICVTIHTCPVVYFLNLILKDFTIIFICTLYTGSQGHCDIIVTQPQLCWKCRSTIPNDNKDSVTIDTGNVCGLWGWLS